MNAALEAIREYLASEGWDGFRAELRAAVFLGASIAAIGFCAAVIFGGN